MKHKVTCTECDFETVEPDFSNADLARDGHELEMFNWRSGESCGPCEITEVNDEPSEAS